VSHQLVFGPKAEEAYESLPLSLLDEFDRHMDRLAESPATVAVPGTFPFPANRMVFHFEMSDHTGETWHFVAHFRYGSDEQTLHVVAITVLPPA